MVERTNPSASLALSLGQARRRWRLRHLAAGAVIVVAALGVTVWGAAAVMERLRFNAESVVLGRIILGLVAAVVGVRWILYPLLRRITDDRLALYLEEKVPSLDGAVLSAVEVQRMPTQSEARSPLLERGLLTDAVRRLERAPEIPVLERPATLKSAAVATLLMAGVVAFIAFGPSYVRQGTRLMLTPWSDPAAAPVYAIALEPGDLTVARGSDVQVNARLQGFTSELVEIVVRRGADGDWQRIPMGPSADSGAMTARLFDVSEDAEYFVEASNVRSPVARLTVRDLPAIDSVAVELRFPGYTGLAPEKVTNGGDIAALAGTRATVQVRVSRTVRAGSIVFDNGSRIPLTVTNGTELSAAMIIRKDGFYRVELEAEDGTKVPGPIEYVIDALDDAPPGVSITKPGRDMRPSAVDEVLIEAEATDDYGVGRMELVYRVNGGAEQVIPLTEGTGRRAREMSAAHTIFLEEMGLQPGDVVAYFARAWDNSAAKQQAASDIYFLTVRPFDRTFRQNQQGGGGGGGGGGENNPGAIVEQQREIISATYKAQRDSARTNARTLREDVATIHLSQGKLREQVAQMITRLQRPGVQQADSGFRKILEYMKEAQEEMQAAEQELAKPELGSALGPEQRALQQAERAEAVFRDVQVSMQQGGGGGGGGGNANASDLADMLELETDKMRNQYEGVQRSQQEQAEQQVDETLERLKRLAARQQQENEKLRQRAQQMQGGAGGGGGSQRQLAEETEQLARQLERLAREQQNPEMRETARRLQDAANQMRRSASSNGSAGSGSGGAAAEQLEQARRLLEEAQRNTATSGAAEAAQRAERLAAQQREVGKEVESLEAG
ncbi:MAG: hypothetical protein JNJ98_07400, partial [Gemmatimonadetes bacterium]|nr:hypothetical protein [Gemmatimonadota bacterium]